MNITITCPICGKQSKIDAKFKGKRLRCPYPDCRRPFRIDENGVALRLEAPGGGTAPPRTPAWEEAPPVREMGTQGPAGWETGPAPWSTAESEPVEVTPIHSGTETIGETHYAPVVSHARRRTWIMYGILGLALVVIAAIGTPLAIKYLGSVRTTEAALREQAENDFKNQRWLNARDAYRKLAERNPSSSDAPRYLFRASLADMRLLADDPAGDLTKAQAVAKELVEKHKSRSPYKEAKNELWEALTDATGLVRGMAKKAEVEGDPALVDRAHEVFEWSQDVGTGISEAAKVEAEIIKLLQVAKEAAAATQARKALQEQFKALLDKKEPGAAEKAEDAYEAAAKKHPRLANDAEIKKHLDEFKANEAAWVRFVPAPAEADAGPAPKNTEGTSLAVCPLVDGSPPPAPPDDAVVLALARGILYALAQTNGEFRWAMRVGIDNTHLLPVRLPARPELPELALVISTHADETHALSAVETQTGTVRWHFRVTSPCKAGVIVGTAGNRIYLPTMDGKVHVLDTVGGKLIGHYEIGVPLTIPGAFDSNRQRLYVPAERKRIYILDVQKNVCAGVVHTGHSTGAVRAAPVLVGSANRTTVVIAEETNLHTTKVRAITLSGGPEGTIGPEYAYSVPGTALSPFYAQGDNLGLVTDQGSLGLYGINRGTRGNPVFELAKPPLSLEDARGSAAKAAASDRPQIVHVSLNQWWLLRDGELRRYQFDLYRQQLVSVKEGEPLKLGQPLHESQQAARGSKLIIVTQPADQAQGLATAIDTAKGTLLWQRQLGMVMSETPRRLEDHLLALDHAGGLFHVQAAKLTSLISTTGVTPVPHWRLAGQWLGSGPEGTSPRLVTSSEHPFALATTAVPSLAQIVLRKYEPGKGVVGEWAHPLDSAAAGTAALGTTSLILPCRDGNLYEFPLQRATRLPAPFVWRDRGAGPQAAGHALLLAEDQLIVTDGLRKLQRWNRAGEGQPWQRAPGEIELPARIAAAPAVVTVDGKKHLCVGDDTGALHLFAADGQLPVRQWRLKGRITRGPFVRGSRIGCIVEEVLLVWLDPASDKELWEYSSSKPGICGEPQLDGDLLLVTELSGAFTWLDAATGEVRGRKELQTHVVPAASAIPFAADWFFAPLSDGTILLLSRARE